MKLFSDKSKRGKNVQSEPAQEEEFFNFEPVTEIPQEPVEAPKNEINEVKEPEVKKPEIQVSDEPTVVIKQRPSAADFREANIAQVSKAPSNDEDNEQEEVPDEPKTTEASGPIIREPVVREDNVREMVIEEAGAEEPEEESEEEPEKKGMSKGAKAAIITLSSIVAVLVLGFFGLGYYVHIGDTIFKGISYEDISLEEMTVDEAKEALIAAGVSDDADLLLNVQLPGGCEAEISARTAGYFSPASEAAHLVEDYCHGQGFFKDTITFIRSFITGIELTVSDILEPEEEYILEVAKTAASDAKAALEEGETVQIEETEIKILKGAELVQIDENAIHQVIVDALKDGLTEVSYVPQQSGEAEPVDFEAIHEEVFAEPENAAYDPETEEVTEHVTGVDFDVEEAERLWNEADNGTMVIIPLEVVEPEITKEALEDMLFADVLAQKTTDFKTSNSNRITNITLAAKAIDGIVLNPGEEFSFNDVVGERTEKAGYKSAGAYAAGKVVNELGGGICQVSSTLYYCAVMSNLEIVDRSAHQFGVDYLPAGLDAAVSWGGPEFKFKNSSDYPIRIEAKVDEEEKTITVEIYGSNPEGIKVDIRSEQEDTKGGYTVQTYRLVYDKDGELISEEKEAKSDYQNHGGNPPPKPSAKPTTPPSQTPAPAPTPAPNPGTNETPEPDTPVDPE